MKTKLLFQNLKRLKEKKQLCRFYIVLNEAEKYFDGFILELSKNFTLVKECSDFNIKGFILVENKKITKIRHGRYEIAFTKILKEENLLKKIFDYEKIELNNHVDILRQIKRMHKFVIVESVYDEKLDFCIGEITRINKDKLSVLYFDATGKLDKTSTIFPFKEILTIEYDSDYINIFKRHLRK